VREPRLAHIDERPRGAALGGGHHRRRGAGMNGDATRRIRSTKNKSPFVIACPFLAAMTKPLAQPLPGYTTLTLVSGGFFRDRPAAHAWFRHCRTELLLSPRLQYLC
jgi:hypothetical protein